MHVSLFAALDRPQASTHEITWAQLETLLTHTVCARKEDQRLFNFCRFSTPYRSNANVVDVSALMLDIDDQPLEVVQGLNAKLALYQHLGYSTHRHGLEPGVYRLRVVVALSRPVLRDEWSSFAASIQKWLGTGMDACVARPSQAYYLPSHPEERIDSRLRWTSPGALLDVQAILATAPDVREADTEAPDTWRPEQTYTLDHLRRLPGEVPARLLRGEKLSPEGQRHDTRRNLVFQFLCTYGPGEPDGALLHLLTASADAPRETWIREFTRGSARAKAEAAYTRQLVSEAQSNAMADLADRAANEALARASADAQIMTQAAHTAFSDQIVKEIAKKARNPITKAVLLAACSGSGVPPDLREAVPEAGRWLGFREAGRTAAVIKKAFTHTIPEDRDRLFAGIDLGVAQAANKEAWRRALTMQEDKASPCEKNIRVVLQTHPACAGQLVYDSRADKVRVGNVPWQRAPSVFWTSADAGGAMYWLTDTLDVPVKTSQVETALEGMKEALPQYDSVQAYLQTLPPWDGTERLSQWLVLYAGAADSPYCRAVARASLISAVARALKPGCQADQTVVLEGSQGVGKTSLLRALCPDHSWFLTLEGALSLDNVRMVHKMQGAWIVELGELSGLRRSQQEAAKAFLSEREDSYRAPYARHVVTRPRRAIFFGTTNRDDYLQDDTGNRRWLPLAVGDCKPAMLLYVREQLWAEAVAAFAAGEKWWVDQTPDVIAVQSSRVQEHPFEGRILECAEHFGEVTCRQIAAYLGLDPESREKYVIQQILRRHGYRCGPKKRQNVVLPVQGAFVGSEILMNERFWMRTPTGPDKVPG